MTEDVYIQRANNKQTNDYCYTASLFYSIQSTDGTIEYYIIIPLMMIWLL